MSGDNHTSSDNHMSSDNHRATAIVVGAAALAWDQLGTARRRAASARRRSALRAMHTLDRVRGRLAELAERGAIERERGRRQAEQAVATLTEVVAASPVLNRVVDTQLDRALRPLLVRVLDEVLELLEADPDRVRSVIRGQRDSMVDELVEHLRDGATAGDAAVDRFTARVLRRADRPEPVPRGGPPAPASRPGRPEAGPAGPA
jgi:hypothetical protein